MNRVLHQLREAVLESPVATRIFKVPVTAYRKGIYYYGPEKAKVSVAENLSAEFYTETTEEIRHFYPVYGELDNLSSLVDDLQSDDVFYDIGAHVGIYSCVVGKVIGGSQVFAFEPHPKNASRIRENAELNDVSGIHVYQLGLSDSAETAELGIDADEPGAVGHSDSVIRKQRVDVEYVRGDRFVANQQLPYPTVIKVDIEGAELTALRGLEGVLDECRLIYCEMSDRLEHYGDSKEKLLNWLNERGFEVESLGKGGVDHDDIRAVRR